MNAFIYKGRKAAKYMNPTASPIHPVRNYCVKDSAVKAISFLQLKIFLTGFIQKAVFSAL